MQTTIPRQYSGIQSLAFIGNFLPRKCGIATFTTDLVNAIGEAFPATDCWTLAMNDQAGGYDYPDVVRFELQQQQLADYSLAADYLNINQPDVICIQHEYGIFGGSAGSHLLKLMSEARAPIITTLHTVLTDPTDDYRHVLLKIGEYSDKLVVMSHKAVSILQELYHIKPEKISYIPHGIPDTPFVDPSYYKDQFGVMGKKLLLTFGLLSKNKGIEYVIDALPRVVEKFPDVVYLVLGATHPSVLRDEGEEYRLQLQKRLRQLGLEDHVVFHNRFVSLNELCEYLSAADIYITPYIGEAQITSGTLAYAMGTGKPVISTPYWYAEEMLADNRGKLVPFKDADAIGDAIIDYLSNEELRHITRKKAYDFTRPARWRDVAAGYMQVFSEVIESRAINPKPAKPLVKISSRQNALQELPKLRLNHLFALTDDTGMLQHAKYTVPDRNHGYCTDDNARALIVAAQAMQGQTEQQEKCERLCDTYLSFLGHAFNPRAGRFRNFMDYQRHWLEEEGSEDSHGRAVWALGYAVRLLAGRPQLPFASTLFKRAINACEKFDTIRGHAFSLLGFNAYLDVFSGDSEVRRLRNTLADKLLLAFSTDDAQWPWPEQALTYDNARMSEALISSGVALDNKDMLNTGLNLLQWLMEVQTDNGIFVPIGNHGWYPKDKQPARFDQQPLEACAAIEACVAAYNATQKHHWRDKAMLAFNWYLGQNDLNMALYDARSGGCYDGLESNGVNLNQGAESCLAWLQSLFALHAVYADDTLAGSAKIANSEEA